MEDSIIPKVKPKAKEEPKSIEELIEDINIISSSKGYPSSPSREEDNSYSSIDFNNYTTLKDNFNYSNSTQEILDKVYNNTSSKESNKPTSSRDTIRRDSTSSSSSSSSIPKESKESKEDNSIYISSTTSSSNSSSPSRSKEESRPTTKPSSTRRKKYIINSSSSSSSSSKEEASTTNSPKVIISRKPLNKSLYSKVDSLPKEKKDIIEISSNSSSSSLEEESSLEESSTRNKIYRLRNRRSIYKINKSRKEDNPKVDTLFYSTLEAKDNSNSNSRRDSISSTLSYKSNTNIPTTSIPSSSLSKEKSIVEDSRISNILNLVESYKSRSLSTNRPKEEKKALVYTTSTSLGSKDKSIPNRLSTSRSTSSSSNSSTTTTKDNRYIEDNTSSNNKLAIEEDSIIEEDSSSNYSLDIEDSLLVEETSVNKENTSKDRSTTSSNSSRDKDLLLEENLELARPSFRTSSSILSSNINYIEDLSTKKSNKELLYKDYTLGSSSSVLPSLEFNKEEDIFSKGTSSRDIPPSSYSKKIEAIINRDIEREDTTISKSLTILPSSPSKRKSSIDLTSPISSKLKKLNYLENIITKTSSSISLEERERIIKENIKLRSLNNLAISSRRKTLLESLKELYKSINIDIVDFKSPK